MGKMGQRKTEQYHRVLSWLKGMMGLNLALLALVIIFGVRAISGKGQVKELTAKLEAVQQGES